MDGFDNGQNVETVETVDNNQSYEGASNQAYTQTIQDEPVRVYSQKIFGIISLICGILGLLCSCCGWIGIVLGVAAVVLGILSFNKKEDAKGMAIAGIVCGGIGIVIAIIALIAGAAISGMDPDALTEYVEKLETM